MKARRNEIAHYARSSISLGANRKQTEHASCARVDNDDGSDDNEAMVRVTASCYRERSPVDGLGCHNQTAENEQHCLRAVSMVHDYEIWLQPPSSGSTLPM